MLNYVDYTNVNKRSKGVINMVKAWILMLILLSSSVLANTENVINVDRAIPNSLHLAFPNDANITPKKRRLQCFKLHINE